MASKKGKTICLFSAKGGVGKTVLTLNLAGIFKNLKKSVLIIDLDLASGGIALATNKEPNKTLYNLALDIANNKCQDYKNYVTNYTEGIDFIACPKDPRQSLKIDRDVIDAIIKNATMLYDIVLIDTNHDINEINISTLDKVQDILFVLTNDPLDLKNMKSLISIFKDLGFANYKIVLNNSANPFKNYFTMYDLKNILKSEIDYMISPNFFDKNIDDKIINGKLSVWDSKIIGSTDYGVLTTIATDFLKSGEGK